MGPVYEKLENRIIESLQRVTAGTKSRDLAREVLQNAYPFAASRIRFNRFGNLEKGSREIAKALKTLERTHFLRLVYPVTQATLPVTPDTRRFPRLHLLDAGLVGFFSGIRKTIYQTEDISAVFMGQMARQVVGQEILASMPAAGPPGFWVREKLQSSASVDFVIPFDDLLIPVVIRTGEAGSLRSLHQFIEASDHPWAVRLCSDKPGIRQAFTTRGRKFYMLSLPYFLAGKIGEYIQSFIRMTEENGKIAKW